MSPVGIVKPNEPHGVAIKVEGIDTLTYTVDLSQFAECKVQDLSIALTTNGAQSDFRATLKGVDNRYVFVVQKDHIARSWLYIDCVQGTTKSIYDRYHIDLEGWSPHA